MKITDIDLQVARACRIEALDRKLKAFESATTHNDIAFAIAAYADSMDAIFEWLIKQNEKEEVKGA